MLGALAAAWCGAREAAACSPVYEPGIFGKPAFEPADAARVVSEDVEVDCGPVNCRVIATYRLEAAAEARLTFTGRRVLNLAIEIDGAAAATELVPPTAEPRRAFDRDQETTAATVPADARTLRVSATIELWPYEPPCYLDGIRARHPRDDWRWPPSQRILHLFIGVRPRVRFPDGWSLELYQLPPYVERDGHRPYVRLTFQLPRQRLLHGGPFVAAGLMGGDGGLLRLRAGWEIAAPRWLVLALAADTDFSRGATLAVTAESMSRAWIGTMGTSSAGGGLIVAVSPDVRPGGRAQLSFGAGRGRLVISADVLAPVAAGQSFAISAGALVGFSL